MMFKQVNNFNEVGFLYSLYFWKLIIQVFLFCFISLEMYEAEAKKNPWARSVPL